MTIKGIRSDIRKANPGIGASEVLRRTVARVTEISTQRAAELRERNERKATEIDWTQVGAN